MLKTAFRTLIDETIAEKWDGKVVNLTL